MKSEQAQVADKRQRRGYTVSRQARVLAQRGRARGSGFGSPGEWGQSGGEGPAQLSVDGAAHLLIAGIPCVKDRQPGNVVGSRRLS